MHDWCKVCGAAQYQHGNRTHLFKSTLDEAFNRENVPETSSLERELSSVLNKYSAENESNTPDFILAEYLLACLNAFNTANNSCRAFQGQERLNGRG